jgi:uncharacterized membrane protein YphA (DoxX/SURF4 family)
MKWARQNEVQLINQIRAVCLIGFVSCIVISYRVWLPVETYFPALPLILSPQSFSVQITTSALFLIALCLLSFNKPRSFNNLALLFLILYALGDYNRIQPWFFYFIVIFGIITNFKKHQRSLYSIALMLACVYIMSGIQKVNGGFAHSTHPWLIMPITNSLSPSSKDFLNSMWWIGPLVESLAGLGLLFRKTSRVSAVVLILMHTFILFMIGPLGRNTNTVVWPWNLAFMFILFRGFIQREMDLGKFISDKRNIKPTVSILILFLLLPVVSFWGYWPKHFSGALYSGNKIKSEILIPDELVQLLNTEYEPAYNGIEYVILPNAWTIQELHVAMYPSKKAHLTLFNAMCNNYSEYSEYFVFKLMPISNWKTGERDQITYFCSDFE